MKYIIAILSSLILLVACNNRDNKPLSPYFDTQLKIYNVPEFDIKFTISEDFDDWEIADKLPPNILFCGVCNNRRICTMIIETDIQERKITTLTIDEVEGILNSIIAQDNETKFRILEKKISNEILNGQQCFMYEIITELQPLHNETLWVQYRGYIFEKNNKILGIVVTSPFSNYFEDEKIYIQNIIKGIYF